MTTTNKTFTSKSSAVRAAAKALGVTNKMSEVTKVACIIKDSTGQWYWTEQVDVEPQVEEKDDSEKLAQLVEATKETQVQPKEELEFSAPHITDLEAQILLNIAISEYTSSNGCEPVTRDDTTTFAFDVTHSRAEGGALSSLIKKDLVWFDKNQGNDDPEDDVVALSDLGFLVYKQYDFDSLKQRQDKVARPEPVAVVEKEVKSDRVRGNWKRPGEGTLTGRVWAIADSQPNRKAVIAQAASEGLNLNMVAQQYFRWSHRE